MSIASAQSGFGDLLGNSYFLKAHKKQTKVQSQLLENKGQKKTDFIVDNGKEVIPMIWIKFILWRYQSNSS